MNLRSKDLMHLPSVRAALHTPAPVPAPVKARRQRPAKFSELVTWECDGRFYGIVPVETVSEANRRGHWSKHEPRRQAQHLIVGVAARRCTLKPPLRVTLVRLASRSLDQGDNLAMSMKAARDSIANVYGVNDADESLIEWRYGQGMSRENFVVVVIERRPMAA